MSSNSIAGIEAIEPIEAIKPVASFGGGSASFERALRRAVDGGLGRGVGPGSTQVEIGLSSSGSTAVAQNYQLESAALWVGRTPEHTVALAGIMAHANGIHRLDRSISEREPFSGTGLNWEEDQGAAASHPAGLAGKMASRTRLQQTRLQRLTARLLAGLGQETRIARDVLESGPVDVDETHRYPAESEDGRVDSDRSDGAACWGYGATGSFPEQVYVWAKQCAAEIAKEFERAQDEGLADLDELLEPGRRGVSTVVGGEQPSAAAPDVRLIGSGADPVGSLEREVGRILNGYLKKDGRLRAFSLSDLGGNRLTRSTRSIPGSTVGINLDLSVGPNAVEEHASALMLARVGISGWERVPGGAGRADFLAAGVDPDQRVGDGAFLLVGSPDGSVFELSVPCHMCGRRYGAVVAEFLAS